MLYEIKIVADTNDGDYITEVTYIEEELLDKIRPLVEAISDFRPYKSGGRTHEHNFPTGECCREDLGEKTVEELYDLGDEILEIFDDVRPHNEYGIHTIISVEVCPYHKKEILL